MSLCQTKISTDALALKEPCKSEFSFTVYRQALVMLANFQIAVTTTYKVTIEPIGFSLGRHLYSVPLTPGEEVEIEIFRSSKVERELSQQYSTEVEFIEEFSHTCKYEWSKERTTNYKEAGGVTGKIDLGIIEFGGEYEPEYSETEKTFERAIGEYIYKTKTRVDRKFDMQIGLKTEVENRYRSTRKIKNPNICRTLTYNYFQLMRKFKITVTRTGIRFDFIPTPQIPRIMKAYIPAVIRSYAMPAPELKTLVATREEKAQSTESSNPGSSAVSTFSAEGLMAMAMAPAVQMQASTPSVQTLLHPTIEEPHVLELSKEGLLAKMIRQGIIKAGQEKKIDEAIENLRKKFPIGTIVSEKEMCINTNSTHVEPMMGACLACENHIIEIRKLELEKAKAEAEKASEG